MPDYNLVRKLLRHPFGAVNKRVHVDFRVRNGMRIAAARLLVLRTIEDPARD